MTNIALTGAMRSGKDTVADYLVGKYGYTRFAFGDGLKDVCRALYPDQFADGNKPRALLQGFGEDVRKYDSDVWVRKCFARIEGARIDCDNDNGNYTYPFRSVISDLRLPSEIERCRTEGYVIIRVKAPSALRIHRAIESADKFAMSDLTHDTESHVDSFAVDYELENGGTLAELYTQVDAIMADVECVAVKA